MIPKYDDDCNKILYFIFQMESLDRNIGIINSLVWGSVIENRKDPKRVLSTAFHQSFLNGNFIRVPLMYSFNSEENLAFIQGKTESKYN